MRMVSYLKNLIKNYTNKITVATQIRFLRQLEKLLCNGYSLMQSLEVLSWDKQLTDVAQKVSENMVAGQLLDEALKQLDFHYLVTSYLYFSRAKDDLESSVSKCAQLLETRSTYKTKLQQVLRYPVILLFIFFVLLFFVKYSVLPTFIDMLDAHAEGTNVSVILLSILDISINLFIVSLLITLVITLMWQRIKLKLSLDKKLDIYQRIPIFRYFLKVHTTYLFSIHVSILLEIGMPIKDVLKQMVAQKDLAIISHYAELMADELSEGKSVTFLIEQLPFLERQLSYIFKQNLNVEQLSKDLSVYADMLMDTIHFKTMKYIEFIQPAFLVIFASFIIFIYVTLMWPMFDLVRTI